MALLCNTHSAMSELVLELEDVIQQVRGSVRDARPALPASEAVASGGKVTIAQAVEKIDRAAAELRASAQRSIAFARTLETGEALSVMDPDGGKYDSLSEFERDFRDIGSDQMRMARSRRSLPAPVRRAIERFALACSAQAAASRQLKGAIQAHDASSQVRRNHPRDPANDPAALERQLRNAAQG